MAVSRDPAKRRRIRALEAKRDNLTEKRAIAQVELRKTRAEIKALKLKR